MTEENLSIPYAESDLLAALELQYSWGASSIVAPEVGSLLDGEEFSIPLGRDVAVRPDQSASEESKKSERPSISAAEREKRIANSTTVEELMQAISLMREVRPLVSGASHTLMPILVENSKLLVVGELPSDEEDRDGELFVDELGHYFKSMLRSVHIDIERVSRMSLSPWRLPGGRKRALAPKELSAVRSLIGRLITLGKIERIITVGNDAALALVDFVKEGSNTTSIMKDIRGQWQKLNGDITYNTEAASELLVFPIPQIRQLSQSATMKRLVWQDLQNLRDDLKGII